MSDVRLEAGVSHLLMDSCWCVLYKVWMSYFTWNMFISSWAKSDRSFSAWCFCTASFIGPLGPSLLSLSAHEAFAYETFSLQGTRVCSLSMFTCQCRMDRGKKNTTFLQHV